MNPLTLAHTSDPEESKLAAINLNGSTSEQVMHIVVDVLVDRGPMTPTELEAHYFQHQVTENWPMVAFYSIHRRVSEMKTRVGVLRGVGRRDGSQLLNLTDNARQAHIDISDYFRKDAA